MEGDSGMTSFLHIKKSYLICFVQFFLVHCACGPQSFFLGNVQISVRTRFHNEVSGMVTERKIKEYCVQTYYNKNILIQFTK